jgi:hypothetical protein
MHLQLNEFQIRISRGTRVRRTKKTRRKVKRRSTDDIFSSKASKGKKEKTKCSYCNREFDPESSCMKNTIELMA